MENKMARGKKTCPDCGTELGARTQLCKCGYHYPSNKVNKDLLAGKKEAPKKKMTMGRGRKQCPDCNAVVGVRTTECKCGHDFSTKVETVAPKKEAETVVPKKTRKERKSEELLQHVQSHPYEPTPRMTPDEHADRILSYGRERALNLFKQHLSMGGWSHVNWKKIDEELKK